MSRAATVLLVVAGCAGPPCPPAPPPTATAPMAPASMTSSAPAPNPPTDLEVRAELQRLLEHDAAAWNRGDLDAFVATYADDALFVSPSGITEGRARVLARYRAKYGDAPETMGHLSLTIVDVDVTRADDGSPRSAVVVGRWDLRWSDRAPPDDVAEGHTLLAFRRGPEGWRIVYDASM